MNSNTTSNKITSHQATVNPSQTTGRGEISDKDNLAFQASSSGGANSATPLSRSGSRDSLGGSFDGSSLDLNTIPERISGTPDDLTKQRDDLQQALKATVKGISEEYAALENEVGVMLKELNDLKAEAGEAPHAPINIQDMSIQDIRDEFEVMARDSAMLRMHLGEYSTKCEEMSLSPKTTIETMTKAYSTATKMAPKSSSQLLTTTAYQGLKKTAEKINDNVQNICEEISGRMKGDINNSAGDQHHLGFEAWTNQLSWNAQEVVSKNNMKHKLSDDQDITPYPQSLVDFTNDIKRTAKFAPDPSGFYATDAIWVDNSNSQLSDPTTQNLEIALNTQPTQSHEAVMFSLLGQFDASKTQQQDTSSAGGADMAKVSVSKNGSKRLVSVQSLFRGLGSRIEQIQNPKLKTPGPMKLALEKTKLRKLADELPKDEKSLEKELREIFPGSMSSITETVVGSLFKGMNYLTSALKHDSSAETFSPDEPATCIGILSVLLPMLPHAKGSKTAQKYTMLANHLLKSTFEGLSRPNLFPVCYSFLSDKANFPLLMSLGDQCDSIIDKIVTPSRFKKAVPAAHVPKARAHLMQDMMPDNNSPVDEIKQTMLFPEKTQIKHNAEARTHRFPGRVMTSVYGIADSVSTLTNKIASFTKGPWNVRKAAAYRELKQSINAIHEKLEDACNNLPYHQAAHLQMRIKPQLDDLQSLILNVCNNHVKSLKVFEDHVANHTLSVNSKKQSSPQDGSKDDSNSAAGAGKNKSKTITMIPFHERKDKYHTDRIAKFDEKYTGYSEDDVTELLRNDVESLHAFKDKGFQDIRKYTEKYAVLLQHTQEIVALKETMAQIESDLGEVKAHGVDDDDVTTPDLSTIDIAKISAAIKKERTILDSLTGKFVRSPLNNDDDDQSSAGSEGSNASVRTSTSSAALSTTSTTSRSSCSSFIMDRLDLQGTEEIEIDPALLVDRFKGAHPKDTVKILRQYRKRVLDKTIQTASDTLKLARDLQTCHNTTERAKKTQTDIAVAEHKYQAEKARIESKGTGKGTEGKLKSLASKHKEDIKTLKNKLASDQKLNENTAKKVAHMTKKLDDHGLVDITSKLQIAASDPDSASRKLARLEDSLHKMHQEISEKCDEFRNTEKKLEAMASKSKSNRNAHADEARSHIEDNCKVINFYKSGGSAAIRRLTNSPPSHKDAEEDIFTTVSSAVYEKVPAGGTQGASSAPPSEAGIYDDPATYQAKRRKPPTSDDNNIYSHLGDTKGTPKTSGGKSPVATTEKKSKQQLHDDYGDADYATVKQTKPQTEKKSKQQLHDDYGDADYATVKQASPQRDKLADSADQKGSNAAPTPHYGGEELVYVDPKSLHDSTEGTPPKSPLKAAKKSPQKEETIYADLNHELTEHKVIQEKVRKERSTGKYNDDDDVYVNHQAALQVAMRDADKEAKIDEEDDARLEQVVNEDRTKSANRAAEKANKFNEGKASKTLEKPPAAPKPKIKTETTPPPKPRGPATGVGDSEVRNELEAKLKARRDKAQGNQA